MRTWVLVVVALGSSACGGGDDGETPQPDANVVDAAHSDAAAPDARPSIAGSTAITARFVSYSVDYLVRTPVSDAKVRIESAAGYLESATAADGTVSFMVDAALGPFDITFIKPGFQVISVLDQTGPLGDVVTGSLTLAPTLTIAGAITNKVNADDRVIVDGVQFATTVATGPSYSTQALGPVVPSPIVGLELDATGVAVNAVATPNSTHAGTTLTADLAFPSPANPPTTVAMSVKLPTTGAVRGADLSSVQSPLGLPCQVYVGKELSANVTLTTGCGQVGALASNERPLTLQTFGGELAPTSAAVAFSSPTAVLIANFPIAADTTVTVPPVTMLSVGGGTLGDVQLDVVGADWNFVTTAVQDETGQFWLIYAPHANLAQRALPNLPTTAASAGSLGAHTGTATVVSLIIKTSHAEPPWQHDHQLDRVIAYTGRQVSTNGR